MEDMSRLGEVVKVITQINQKIFERRRNSFPLTIKIVGIQPKIYMNKDQEFAILQQRYKIAKMKQSYRRSTDDWAIISVFENELRLRE